MAFKKIRELADLDTSALDIDSDHLVISDNDAPGINGTKKMTVRDLIGGYNVKLASEQPAGGGEPTTTQDSNGNTVSADPMTAANIDDFVDPTSGLEVETVCTDNADGTRTCAKKLKIATSVAATTIKFIIWPQRTVASKYTGATVLNDIVNSDTINTEDIYRNSANNPVDVGTVDNDFVMFEPGVSNHESRDYDWGKNASGIRATPRFSMSGAVCYSSNSDALRTEFGLSPDWQFGTTFSQFGDDPVFFADEDCYSSVGSFPSSITSETQKKEYMELKYGINTASMNHALYSIEFHSNPYNKLLTQDDVDAGNVHYLDARDAQAGTVDYYFGSMIEVSHWVTAKYGGSKPPQTTVNIFFKDDVLERASTGFFFQNVFQNNAIINIFGAGNQEANQAGHYSDVSTPIGTNGDNPTINNLQVGNYSRRQIVVCNPRFGVSDYSPAGTLMRSGGYRNYGEIFNAKGTQTVNLNKMRWFLEKPTTTFSFINATSESVSYLWRFSGSTAWINDCDFIVNGGSLFTMLEGEANSTLYFKEGGSAYSENNVNVSPDFRLFQKVGHGGGVRPTGITESQIPNQNTSSFDPDQVIPPFSAQFIFRNKSFCRQLIYLNKSFLKGQAYNGALFRDAVPNANSKGDLTTPPSGASNYYTTLTARWHVATDSNNGGALGRYIVAQNGSSVEFNIPVTTDRQGFIHWAHKEYADGSFQGGQTSSSGQLYGGLLRDQSFFNGMVTGDGFTSFGHGQNNITEVSPPGTVIIPHSNEVTASFLDSKKWSFGNGITTFTGSLINHNVSGSDFLANLKTVSGIIDSKTGNIFQSPYNNVGRMYPIIAHGGAETRKKDEIVEIWDSGNNNGSNGTVNVSPKTATEARPLLRRFKLKKDTTDPSYIWPANHNEYYEQITGDHTLPAKFNKQFGYLFNRETGEITRTLPHVDIVIGIKEYLIFPNETDKDFVVNSQFETAETNSVGEISGGVASNMQAGREANVFVCNTANEAMPFHIHPNVGTLGTLNLGLNNRSIFNHIHRKQA
tara:strand:- start:4347 stop:7421 length:3075 start_codon:yes stop_codon:yes gene_type:complete